MMHGPTLTRHENTSKRGRNGSKNWGQSSRVILLTTHPPPLPLSLLLYLSPHIELDRSVRAVPPLPSSADVIYVCSPYAPHLDVYLPSPPARRPARTTPLYRSPHSAHSVDSFNAVVRKRTLAETQRRHTAAHCAHCTEQADTLLPQSLKNAVLVNMNASYVDLYLVQLKM